MTAEPNDLILKYGPLLTEDDLAVNPTKELKAMAMEYQLELDRFGPPFQVREYLKGTFVWFKKAGIEARTVGSGPYVVAVSDGTPVVFKNIFDNAFATDDWMFDLGPSRAIIPQGTKRSFESVSSSDYPLGIEIGNLRRRTMSNVIARMACDFVFRHEVAHCVGQHRLFANEMAKNESGDIAVKMKVLEALADEAATNGLVNELINLAARNPLSKFGAKACKAFQLDNARGIGFWAAIICYLIFRSWLGLRQTRHPNTEVRVYMSLRTITNRLAEYVEASGGQIEDKEQFLANLVGISCTAGEGAVAIPTIDRTTKPPPDGPGNLQAMKYFHPSLLDEAQEIVEMRRTIEDALQKTNLSSQIERYAFDTMMALSR